MSMSGRLLCILAPAAVHADWVLGQMGADCTVTCSNRALHCQDEAEKQMSLHNEARGAQALGTATYSSVCGAGKEAGSCVSTTLGLRVATADKGFCGGEMFVESDNDTPAYPAIYEDNMGASADDGQCEFSVDPDRKPPTCGAKRDVLARFCCCTSTADGATAATDCPDLRPSTYFTGGEPELRNTSYDGSTNRSSNISYSGIDVPDALMGEPFAYNMSTGQNVSYTDANHLADDAVLGATAESGNACSARGFKCDFKDAGTHMGPYKPLDFVWKIVDPRDYNKPSLAMKTLNCEIEITAADTTSSSDYFYVPIGQNQVGNTDYCDVEAVRRVVNQMNITMTDRIRVRGETARLNNRESSFDDLIGEQFDLICECKQDLSMEASLDVKQESTAMLIRMTSTGQTRKMGIQLLLYSDNNLTQQVDFTAGDLFPTLAPSFFFVVRHELNNDWDAMLQINKCVACDPNVGCNTTHANDYAVTFYDNCDVLIGGPRRRAISNTSWYSDPTTPTPNGNAWKPLGRWSEQNPLFCPYHAIGMQKFRLQASKIMRVVCHVTGCSKRPCPPCTREFVNIGRRRLSSLPRRSLQEQDGDQIQGNDVGMRINFAEAPAAPVANNDEAERSAKKKKKTNGFLLLILLLLSIIAAILVSRSLRKKKQADTQRKVVDVAMTQSPEPTRPSPTRRQSMVA